METVENTMDQHSAVKLLENISNGCRPRKAERKELADVRELELAQSQIRVLEKGASYLHGLQILRLKHSRIHTLPASLGLLTQLQQLEIDCQNLKSLPDSIGNLAHLKSLRLFCPSLQMFPPPIRSPTVSGKPVD